MALDIDTPKGCFGSTFPRFRIGNTYATPVHPPFRSVSLETSLLGSDFPYLVAGYFNIHVPAADPFSVLSPSEEKQSAPVVTQAGDMGFSLLNTRGTYTRFPFYGSHRHSTIELAFANPLMFPATHHWEASALPLTGSDHLPILISLQPPITPVKQSKPCRQDVDYCYLTEKLKDWQIPPPSTSHSPKPLDFWFSSALSVLTSTIEASTSRSRRSSKSKPWWISLHTSLRKELSKDSCKAKKLLTHHSIVIAKESKPGYFKAIQKAKASSRAYFLAKTSPQTIWMAKDFITPRKPLRFPSLPGATNPVSISKALLDRFFPLKDPLPPRGCLSRDLSADPLTADDIRHAPCQSFPSSAPGPDGIPYSVWKKVHRINRGILLYLLSPVVTFNYNPLSLKTANRVLLDKPGKSSNDTPASFRIMVPLNMVS